MEGPPSSKYTAVVGRDRERKPVCDGIGVDAKR